MNELRHLLDEDPTEPERALLEAARSDGPPDGAGKARTLLALSTLAAAPPPAPPPQAPAATGGALSWLGAGAGGLLIAAGGLWVAMSGHPEPRPLGAPVPTASAPARLSASDPAPVAVPSRDDAPDSPAPPVEARPPALPSPASPASPASPSPASPSPRAALARSGLEASPAASIAVPAPASAEVPAAPTTPTTASAAPPASPAETAPASSAPASSAPASSAASLGQEVAALQEARQRLAAGDPTRALASLDDYRARFPRGALSSEALVIRVQALLARGDQDAAASLARGFIQSYPSSPFAARLRRLFPAGTFL